LTLDKVTQMAYGDLSLTDLDLHTKFIRIRETFCGPMDICTIVHMYLRMDIKNHTIIIPSTSVDDFKIPDN